MTCHACGKPIGWWAVKACDVTVCLECRAMLVEAMAQRQHEESVKWQKAKLRFLGDKGKAE